MLFTRPIHRLAVLRALPGLGDFLCATPALRALREALPHTHITLIGLPWVGDLSLRYGLWDAFLPFPGAPGLPEVPFDASHSHAFKEAQRGRFGAALQLHGSGPQSNAFVRGLDAPLSAGFYPAGQAAPGPHFLPWLEREHEADRWLRLLAHLGVPAQGTALSFPLLTGDVEQADALRRTHGLSDVVILHPGAAERSKRWSLEGFTAVGREVQRLGLQAVITGSASEASLAATLHRRLPGATNLCGETDLGTLAALIGGARLLICNDTGVSHLAAATRTPSVVLFSETDPARWAPLDGSRHVALSRPGVAAVVEAAHKLLSGYWGNDEHPDLARPRGVPVLPNA